MTPDGQNPFYAITFSRARTLQITICGKQFSVMVNGRNNLKLNLTSFRKLYGKLHDIDDNSHNNSNINNKINNTKNLKTL